MKVLFLASAAVQNRKVRKRRPALLPLPAALKSAVVRGPLAPNPSIERTSYRWLRHRQAAAHVER
jgi:hypothetical protein